MNMTEAMKEHPIEIGFGRHTWTVSGRVCDEEGNEIFYVRCPNPVTEEMARACLEAYFDGHRHGRASGSAAKLIEIQNALGIPRDNLLR